MEGPLFLFTLLVVLGIAVWTIMADNAERQQSEKQLPAAASDVAPPSKLREPRKSVIVRRSKF
jgi:hypothetical protein